MLRRTNATLATYQRAWTPYALFLVKSKSHSALQGKTVAARGKLLGQMYRNLKPAELAALKAEAAKKPLLTIVRKKSATMDPPVVKVKGSPRPHTKYHGFLARYLMGREGPMKDTMKAASKAWKNMVKI